MPLLLKPHTFLIELPQANVRTADKAALPTTFLTGVTVTGHAIPTSADAAFQEFNIELAIPVKVLLDDTDFAKVKFHARVTWNGTQYLVKAEPRLRQAGLPVDHCLFVMDAIQL